MDQTTTGSDESGPVVAPTAALAPFTTATLVLPLVPGADVVETQASAAVADGITIPVDIKGAFGMETSDRHDAARSVELIKPVTPSTQGPVDAALFERVDTVEPSVDKVSVGSSGTLDSTAVPRSAPLSGHEPAPGGGDGSSGSQAKVASAGDAGNAGEVPAIVEHTASRSDDPLGSNGREQEAPHHAGVGGDRRLAPGSAVDTRPSASERFAGEWIESPAGTAVVDTPVEAGVPAESSARVSSVDAMQTVARGLVERVQTMRSDDAHAWSVQLEPDEFGSVRVQVVVQDQRVSADILTSHPLMRDLFQQHQSELRQALSDYGLRVDRLSVSVGDAGQHLPNRSWDFGRESWPGRERAPEWATPRTEPNAAAMRWTAWADAGARHAVNVYV
ncbi:MAG: flagellar hook-length control protein FliK [Nitrospirota bacterium]